MKQQLACWFLLIAASASAQPSAPGTANEEIRSIRGELEELKTMEDQLHQRIRALEERLDNLESGSASSSSGNAADSLLEPVPAAAVIPGQPAPGAAAPSSEIEPIPTGDVTDGDIWSIPLGSVGNLRLIDIALNFTGAGGWSTQGGGSLQQLEGGGHDPNVRGFTLQDLELSIGGAVDPYFNAESTLSFSANTAGETNFEIEEGFATTQQLPLGLEEYGLQLQAGWFFAHFGRWNQKHVHNWSWVDQPIVTTRFFGPDNLRQAGVNLSWLVPFVPWYAHFDLGVQNSVGETMYSFGANGEIGAIPEAEHEEGGGHGHLDMGLPGGRPFVTNEVNNLADMTYELRFANGFDIGGSWSTEIGASAALGPNPTGKNSRTWIAGIDWTAKWRPTPTDRGWPFVILQAEAMWRNYEAGAYDCAGGGYECDGGWLPETTLKGFGIYGQALWGFRRGWSGGIRGEYAKGRGGPSFELHEEEVAGVTEFHLEPLAVRNDPYRSERWRISPLLMYQPTHFSKIALQYNYDRTTFLPKKNNHTVWLQLQFTLGSEPAHRY